MVTIGTGGSWDRVELMAKPSGTGLLERLFDKPPMILGIKELNSLLGAMPDGNHWDRGIWDRVELMAKPSGTGLLERLFDKPAMISGSKDLNSFSCEGELYSFCKKMAEDG